MTSVKLGHLLAVAWLSISNRGEEMMVKKTWWEQFTVYEEVGPLFEW